MSESSPRMQWPYPTREDDPWYEFFRDYISAADASGYAAREDNSIIWTGGGTVSWDLATETLTWTGTINIYSPIGSRLLQIAAGSIADWKNGEVVYVVLTRQPLANIAASLVKASQLPSNDNARSFAVRIGDVIYFRTGMSLGDGDSSGGIAPVPGGGGGSPLEVDDEGVLVDAAVTLIDFVGAGVTATQTAPGEIEVNIPGGGGGTDRYTAKLIVGNGPAGDTLAECHFLDPGDGTGIVAAIVAASLAGYPYPDVYIRPGVYDLGASGVGMITISSGIRVRGAGRQCVRIVTADATMGTDPHAFRLLDDAELFDVKILATTPDDFSQTATSSIVTVQSTGHVERVEVEFENYWNSIAQPYYAFTRAAFGAYGLPFGTRARFIECFAKKLPYNPAMMIKPWGFDLGGDIADRCYTEGGGDIGISVAGGGIVKECIIENDVETYFTPIEVDFAPHAQIIANKIIGLFDGFNTAGIRLIGADSCTIQGNDLEATAGAPSNYGIEIVQSDDCSVVGNVGIGFVDAISLNAFADDNVVGFNNFAGAVYTDLGVGNDLAHNK